MVVAHYAGIMDYAGIMYYGWSDLLVAMEVFSFTFGDLQDLAFAE